MHLSQVKMLLMLKLVCFYKVKDTYIVTDAHLNFTLKHALHFSTLEIKLLNLRVVQSCNCYRNSLLLGASPPI